MKIYDFSQRAVFDGAEHLAQFKETGDVFVLCKTDEVLHLHDVFSFDESTVINSTDLDESVRYTSFDGYDFVSMVHIEILGDKFVQREINLYVSSRYLVLVMPNHESPRLHKMEKNLRNAVRGERSNWMNRMYFSVFHHLLTDFSDTLEGLEDEMQILSETIVSNPDESHFGKINVYKNMTYALKKQLRALSYLGEQILLDENKLIAKDEIRYFRNINTRLKKLYDFAESLYNLGSEMLYTYDSRLTMKTNDTVNKLAAITLFFGPLTVITGIYGMNFHSMPELAWSFGYPAALGIMVVISVILYRVLKKRNWL